MSSLNVQSLAFCPHESLVCTVAEPCYQLHAAWGRPADPLRSVVPLSTAGPPAARGGQAPAHSCTCMCAAWRGRSPPQLLPLPPPLAGPPGAHGGRTAAGQQRAQPGGGGAQRGAACQPGAQPVGRHRAAAQADDGWAGWARAGAGERGRRRGAHARAGPRDVTVPRGGAAAGERRAAGSISCPAPNQWRPLPHSPVQASTLTCASTTLKGLSTRRKWWVGGWRVLLAWPAARGAAVQLHGAQREGRHEAGPGTSCPAASGPAAPHPHEASWDRALDHACAHVAPLLLLQAVFDLLDIPLVHGWLVDPQVRATEPLLSSACAGSACRAARVARACAVPVARQSACTPPLAGCRRRSCKALPSAAACHALAGRGDGARCGQQILQRARCAACNSTGQRRHAQAAHAGGVLPQRRPPAQRRRAGGGWARGRRRRRRRQSARQRQGIGSCGGSCAAAGAAHRR